MLTLEHSDSDARRFVPSRRELAAALGCSEKTVANMLLEPGNPGTTLNGSYPLDAWRHFFKVRKEGKSELAPEGDPGEMKKAVLRERNAKAEKAELEAARMRGELIAVADAEKIATEFSSRLRALHHRRATVEAVNELSFSLFLDGEQSAKLLEYMEKFHENFCNAIADLRGELAEDAAS